MRRVDGGQGLLAPPTRAPDFDAPDQAGRVHRLAEFRGHVEKLFTYITGAYTVLSNPASRASYDSKRLKEGSKVEAAQEARSGVDRESERMAEALYSAAGAAAAGGDVPPPEGGDGAAPSSGSGGPGGKDDVIDAEYTEGPK